MAHALGARVYPLEVGDPPVRLREVGWGAVTFDPNARGDRALDGLGDSEMVVHWHGDTFDLPAGAVRLASTLPCENQMFRYGRTAYALQFHVELTKEDVSDWVEEDRAFVVAANGPAGPARILAESDGYAARYREAGDRMIRNLLAVALEQSG
jgi:GMP synthase (glutamine-hydrolysing)